MAFTKQFYANQAVRIAPEHPTLGGRAATVLAIVYHMDSSQLWVRPKGLSPALVEEPMLKPIKKRRCAPERGEVIELSDHDKALSELAHALCKYANDNPGEEVTVLVRQGDRYSLVRPDWVGTGFRRRIETVTPTAVYQEMLILAQRLLAA